MIWIDSKGNNHLLKNMTVNHIQNCINCIKGIGDVKIPNPHVGCTHQQWLIILENELLIRNNKIYECW